MQYIDPQVVRKREKRLSATLTFLIWGGIMLFFFLYRITMPQSEEKNEVVTTMLINFGDNRNGKGIEEPIEQDGSKIETDNFSTSTPVSTSETSIKKVENSNNDQFVSGTSNNTSIKKNTQTPTKQNNKSNSQNAPINKRNNASGGGDGQGNAAVGNLIRGRGTKPGSQGTGDGVGNSGDPLGGDGYGDSRVGVDRKLVGFIPGTMGRSGSHPEHSCTGTGTIVIGYTVDKTGAITSAKRVSGATDPCIISTATAWVKKYVKAEKANFSSTGTYKITF